MGLADINEPAVCAWKSCPVAGTGARRWPEKKCAQMARTTCSGFWKEESASAYPSLATAALPENDTEEPTAGINGPSSLEGALRQAEPCAREQRRWGRAGAGAGAGRQGAVTGSGPCAP